MREETGHKRPSTKQREIRQSIAKLKFKNDFNFDLMQARRGSNSKNEETYIKVR